MARKQIPESLPPPKLVVSRQEAASRINAQIEKGIAIRDVSIQSEQDLDKAQADKTKWKQFNIELLTRLFDNLSIANEFNKSFVYVAPDHWWESAEILQRHIGKHITTLESIAERLDLIPEVVIQPPSHPSQHEKPSLSKDIFIVHGHDEAAREATARFVEKLGFRPVILHEQPNAGKTLIEKFERNANAAFAIVLLTPDDVGYPKDKPEAAKPRARQNVIFELGYFLGKLERAKVCALYKGEVEILSDYQGVLYIPMDSGGAWRLLLAKEIKEAGLDVDLNKAF